MMTMQTEKYGSDSMDKKSAIQEYCEACRSNVGVSKNETTNYELHEQHLQQQDLLLRIIQEQSRPQFGREVLANIVGDASYDLLLGVLKRIIR